MSQGLINIIFKITGDTGGFKKLAVDADGFKKLIGETVGEAEKLKKHLSTLRLFLRASTLSARL